MGEQTGASRPGCVNYHFPRRTLRAAVGRQCKMLWRGISNDSAYRQVRVNRWGVFHLCGLRTDGAITCWWKGGVWSTYGEADAPHHYDFTAVVAGCHFTCGLYDDGTVTCSGRDNQNQTTAPGGRFALPDSGSSSRSQAAYDSFDASSILARFSTPDPLLGEARADAASEIVTRHKSGDVGTGRVLDLLHIIAPELSIEERRRAADELARLSEDGDWSDANTFNAVQHLAAVVTGNEINAQERIAAANRMVELYQSGDLGTRIPRSI